MPFAIRHSFRFGQIAEGGGTGGMEQNGSSLCAAHIYLIDDIFFEIIA